MAACVVLHASNIELVLLQEITLSGPDPHVERDYGGSTPKGHSISGNDV